MSKRIIFDFGFHEGDDTLFYLQNGFKVIAIEANPELCEQGRKKFATALQSDQLCLLNFALADSRAGEKTKFYINEVNARWSSLSRTFAVNAVKSNEVVNITEIEVATTTLSHLFDRWGIPHYIKYDIPQGNDLFLQQLMADHRRPSFLSITAATMKDVGYLYGCGYDKYQITNRQNHPQVNVDIAGDGTFKKLKLNKMMHGLFGGELPKREWLEFDAVCEIYTTWLKLRRLNKKLATGRVDFHASFPSALAGGNA